MEAQRAEAIRRDCTRTQLRGAPLLKRRNRVHRAVRRVSTRIAGSSLGDILRNIRRKLIAYAVTLGLIAHEEK